MEKEQGGKIDRMDREAEAAEKHTGHMACWAGLITDQPTSCLLTALL